MHRANPVRWEWPLLLFTSIQLHLIHSTGSTVRLLRHMKIRNAGNSSKWRWNPSRTNMNNESRSIWAHKDFSSRFFSLLVLMQETRSEPVSEGHWRLRSNKCGMNFRIILVGKEKRQRIIENSLHMLIWTVHEILQWDWKSGWTGGQTN